MCDFNWNQSHQQRYSYWRATLLLNLLDDEQPPGLLHFSASLVAQQSAVLPKLWAELTV